MKNKLYWVLCCLLALAMPAFCTVMACNSFDPDVWVEVETPNFK